VSCSKTDRIVRNYADYLARSRDSIGIGIDGALLLMLSTGEEQDLEVARGWVKQLVEKYEVTEYLTYPQTLTERQMAKEKTTNEEDSEENCKDIEIVAGGCGGRVVVRTAGQGGGGKGGEGPARDRPGGAFL
jgi:hypothetical protein